MDRKNDDNARPSPHGNNGNNRANPQHHYQPLQVANKAGTCEFLALF